MVCTVQESNHFFDVDQDDYDEKKRKDLDRIWKYFSKDRAPYEESTWICSLVEPI